MCVCACTQLYISPPFSPLFFISVCFPLCFGNWTRSAVISSENAASGGILDPGTEAKASGITGESPRSPESRRRLFAGWEHASVTRQLARQMLRGLGEGRREGEAGPAAGRCYAAERESIMPAGAGSRTTARPKPPGLRNDSSNQSSGWWCRSITLHIPAHPTLTAYEGGTPAAVILSPEMQTKAQRS